MDTWLFTLKESGKGNIDTTTGDSIAMLMGVN